MKLWLIAAMCCCAAAAQEGAGPCTVEGRAVHASTGEPLRKVRVTLRRLGARGGTPATVTDAAGRFALANVEPGRYRVVAERNGFVREEWGQRRATQPGTVLSLSAGQKQDDIVFRMVPFAVIAGRVLDEDGEPAPRVGVQALRYTYDDGQRRLTPAGASTSDDRGEYRIYGLAPGRYYVGARVLPEGPGDSATQQTYVPLFYPGVTESQQAAPVDVRSGGEAHGVDFRLVRVNTVRVRGRIIPPAGRPERGYVVFLAPRDSAARSFVSPAQSRNPDGNFEIRGVAPGPYLLEAYATTAGRRYSARQPIDVGNSDMDGITLALSAGVSVDGRIRIGDGTDLPPANLRVWLRPRGSGQVSMNPVKPDGTFVAQGLAPETYTVSVVGLKDDYYLKAVRLGGMEALDHRLEITDAAPGTLDIVISAGAAHVEGTVQNEKQEPVPAATVVLIPNARSRRDLYETAATDQNGHFSIGGVTPGEYKIFTWEDVEPGAWEDPDFLRDQESHGLSLSIEERSRHTIQLKSAPSGGS